MKCRKRSEQENKDLWKASRDRWSKQVDRIQAMFDPLPVDPPPPIPVDPPDDPCWVEQLLVWEEEERNAELTAAKIESDQLLDVLRSSLTDCRGGVIV